MAREGDFLEVVDAVHVGQRLMLTAVEAYYSNKRNDSGILPANCTLRCQYSCLAHIRTLDMLPVLIRYSQIKAPLSIVSIVSIDVMIDASNSDELTMRELAKKPMHPLDNGAAIESTTLHKKSEQLNNFVELRPDTSSQRVALIAVTEVESSPSE